MSVGLQSLHIVHAVNVKLNTSAEIVGSSWIVAVYWHRNCKKWLVQLMSLKEPVVDRQDNSCCSLLGYDTM
jgi:hypothetical protein